MHTHTRAHTHAHTRTHTDPAIVNADPLQFILERSTGVLNCSTPNTTTTFHWMFNDNIILNNPNYTQLADGRLQINNMQEPLEGEQVLSIKATCLNITLVSACTVGMHAEGREGGECHCGGCLQWAVCSDNVSNQLLPVCVCVYASHTVQHKIAVFMVATDSKQAAVQTFQRLSSHLHQRLHSHQNVWTT